MGEYMKTLNWIGRTLGKEKWKIIFISVLQGVMAASGVLFAVCLRNVIDSAISKSKYAFVLSIILLAIIIFTQIVLRWLNYFVEDDTRAVIENRFRRKIFRDILNTEYAIEDYAIAIKKGNTKLLDDINGALETLTANGTIDAIISKFIKSE